LKPIPELSRDAGATQSPNFGLTGLLQSLKSWGRSEERQAVQFGRIFEKLASPPSETVGFPTIPACDNLVNSPGTMLRFRLPTESPEAWSLMLAELDAMMAKELLSEDYFVAAGLVGRSHC
jgi:hypothetical protein